MIFTIFFWVNFLSVDAYMYIPIYHTCKLFSPQRGKETQAFLKETGIQAQILVQLLFSIMKPHKNCQKQVMKLMVFI